MVIPSDVFNQWKKRKIGDLKEGYNGLVRSTAGDKGG